MDAMTADSAATAARRDGAATADLRRKTVAGGFRADFVASDPARSPPRRAIGDHTA
jgi:hypothetical protein